MQYDISRRFKTLKTAFIILCIFWYSVLPGNDIFPLKHIIIKILVRIINILSCDLWSYTPLIKKIS